MPEHTRRREELTLREGNDAIDLWKLPRSFIVVRIKHRPAFENLSEDFERLGGIIDQRRNTLAAVGTFDHDLLHAVSVSFVPGVSRPAYTAERRSV